MGAPQCPSPEGLSTLWLASLLPVVQMSASHTSASGFCAEGVSAPGKTFLNQLGYHLLQEALPA